MAETITIRPAVEADVARLNKALSRLSEFLGDTHAATPEDLRRGGFGPVPAFRALLAEAGDEVLGVAMYSPVFSTVRAAPGLYVSDLWVSSAARGRGLGKRLLQAAARDAEEAWGARFLRLVVYEENPGARRFYGRLGFSADPQDIVMSLDETGLNALKGQG